MKLTKLKQFLFILLFLVGFLQIIQAQYQFQVTKATGNNLTQNVKGLYYSLPKTVIKLHLVLEKVNKIRGPFAQYTGKYLGTSDFIKSNESYMRLLKVDVESVNMADNKQLYFVQFPEDRSPKEVRHFGFQLNGEGVLMGFGLITKKKELKKEVAEINQQVLYVDNDKGFSMRAAYSRGKKIDTILRKITIDTLTIKRFLYKTSWVNLSEDDRANDAAMQIKKIRESRFNLLTGYQEVNYGDGIRYMDQELQKMEQQYLALFLGRETKELESLHFVFDPETSNLSKLLMSYTDENGHSHKVLLRITPLNAIHFPSATKAEPDFLFYRIPVKAKVEVLVDGQSFFSEVYSLPQLGVVRTTSLDKTSLRFDPQTGTLIRVEK
jgi:hypothetical protein